MLATDYWQPNHLATINFFLIILPFVVKATMYSPGASLQYLIFSPTGQSMQSGYANRNILTSELASGIYFLQLKTEDGMQVGKLVIE